MDKEEQVKQVRKITKIKSERTYKFSIPKTKFELVRAILVRWWYGMDHFPNPTFDYSEKLLKRKLRLVSSEEWKTEPGVKDGLQKVKACPNFPGWFQDDSGTLHDLRSKKKMPSF